MRYHTEIKGMSQTYRDKDMFRWPVYKICGIKIYRNIISTRDGCKPNCPHPEQNIILYFKVLFYFYKNQTLENCIHGFKLYHNDKIRPEILSAYTNFLKICGMYAEEFGLNLSLITLCKNRVMQQSVPLWSQRGSGN